MKKKLHDTIEKQHIVIPFQPSNSIDPFMNFGARYSNEKMREVIAYNFGARYSIEKYVKYNNVINALLK